MNYAKNQACIAREYFGKTKEATDTSLLHFHFRVVLECNRAV